MVSGSKMIVIGSENCFEPVSANRDLILSRIQNQRPSWIIGNDQSRQRKVTNLWYYLDLEFHHINFRGSLSSVFFICGFFRLICIIDSEFHQFLLRPVTIPAKSNNQKSFFTDHILKYGA
jgi:hypothetical protein